LERGFWIGTAFGAGAVASWPILDRLSYALDYWWSPNQAAGSMIAVLVIGYLAGLGAAIKRPPRRLGLGIFIGVSVSFPGLFLLTWTVLYAIWGGG
jgi:hypothetical protein